MSLSLNARVLAAVGTAAVLSATFLLAPTSTAATARTVTVKATPTAALVGSGVTFAGKLTNSPKGSTVKIQRYIGTKWVTSKSTVTKNDGLYSTKVNLPTKSGYYKYRAAASATSSLGFAATKSVTVTALRKTTFYTVNGYDALYQGDAQAGGTLGAVARLNAPFVAGAVAKLQRLGAVWTTVGQTTVASDGLITLSSSNAQSGQYRILVLRKGLSAQAVSKTRQVNVLP